MHIVQRNIKAIVLSCCVFHIALAKIHAQDSGTVNDGPYVFYDSGNKATIQVITNDDLSHKPQEGKRVQVHFSDHPDWGFSFHLRKILKIEPFEWNAPKKLFVLSDIEGEFEAFRSLLLANHIIDKDYHWTFGKGHLVIDGDLFDRGKNVTEELWLLYKLEDEAKQKGGYVHTLLGNHDIMNLSGDFRYVDKKYFEAAKRMGKDYMQLYDQNTELGRWLRTKNVMEKIGDRLFIHGGVSPAINQMGLSVEDINSKCRKYYGVAKKEIPKEWYDLFNQNALFWYRGYFMNPRATDATIDSTLQFYGVQQIVVGHTIIKGKNPALYYSGRILGIDVNEHEGHRAAVLIEKGRCYKADDQGNKRLLRYLTDNDKINSNDID